MKNSYLTCDEIAKMLKVTKRTVWGWCNKGLLRATCPAGGQYFVSEKDFNDFMESGIDKIAGGRGTTRHADDA